jgi:hypothetical protein
LSTSKREFSLCATVWLGGCSAVAWFGLAALTAASHVPSRKPPSTFSHSLKGIPIYLTKYDRQAAFFKCQNIEKERVTVQSVHKPFLFIGKRTAQR